MKERKSSKPQTKEEIEAYREKKMREEEARYLRAAKKESGEIKEEPKKEVEVKRKRKEIKKVNEEQKPKKRRRRRTHECVVDVPRQPKMLQPLQPLYLLKIPGLPKGSCIAICLAHEEV